MPLPAPTPVVLQSKPGIQRDGTLFAGDAYSDGQWARFQRGLPRKMGGYISEVTTQPEKIYGMYGFAKAGNNYMHVGSANFLKTYVLNANKQLVQAYDRTPASGFVGSTNNVWQLDVLFDQAATLNRIVAHAGQNLADITSSVGTKVFYGTVDATAVLADVGSPAVSGGCLALPPYLLTYGEAGQVNWNAAGNLTSWAPAVGSGTVNVTGSKIVKGLALRGSGQGPAALFWSLDSLIRCNFVGTPGFFAFDTLTASISVLSSRGIVEYLGTYYWAGVDQFYMFNGAVQELPNPFSKNWFFDNLNYAARQKVFAFINTRWGEIWWCYPRGNATECTHAVIYNVNEGYWYDTPLPNQGRTDGTYVKVFANTMLSGSAATASGTYLLWKHDIAMDEVNGPSVLPIDSFITTSEISLLDQQTSQVISVPRVEPDLIQVGPMSVQMIARPNARGPETDGPVHNFSDNADTAPSDQTVPMKEAGRLVRFKFESNTPGGDFQFGKNIVHIIPTEGRIES